MDQAQQLRNIIKQRNQSADPSARVITVTSGKGGVGKSNVAVNLAVQLRKMGKRVLILDADFGLANVEVMFGLMPKYNMSDVIFRGMQVGDIITEGPMDIKFVSGGSGISEMNNLTREQLTILLQSFKELDTMADIILIDTGAGISDNVMELVVASPEVVIVCTPEPSSLTDSYSLLKAMHRDPNFRKETSSVKVISNRVLTVEDGNAVFEKLNSVVGQFLSGSLTYLGVILQDRAIERAVRQQIPVSISNPDSRSSRAFAVLADNLLNNKSYQPKVRNGLIQIISNILNKRL